MKYVYFYNAEILDWYGDTVKRLVGITTSETKIDTNTKLDNFKDQIQSEYATQGQHAVITSLSFLHVIED